jgi:hypothetical protein
MLGVAIKMPPGNLEIRGKTAASGPFRLERRREKRSEV